MPLASASTLMLAIRILLLVLAYFLAGRLALLLAVPPGLATAVSPPMGISLAAVLLWGNTMLVGTFFGSLLLHTSLALSASASISLAAVSVGAEIALGSCFATWVGATLIRRFVGFPNGLLDEWSIFLFFVVGGPLAASISAGVGVAVICANGLIPLSQAASSWAIWWTGDTIGVLIAAPLVLILFAQPRMLWRGRLKTVGLPLIASCALIVIIFLNASRSEQQKVERAHQENAKAIAEKLFAGFNASISALASLRGLYVASDEVTAEDFRLFTVDLLRFESGITALSWNQKVPLSERNEYEQHVVSQGFSDFRIKEYDEQKQLIAAPERPHYIVVTHIEPYSKNVKAHGFNIASEETRRRALQLADQTGRPAMTEPLHLVQSAANELSYLMLMPVYESLDVPKSPDMREQLLRGYVTALVTVNRQIELVQNRFPATDFSISLSDVTEPNRSLSLYKDPRPISAISALYSWAVEESIGGRQLRLTVTPTQQFIDRQANGQSWYVLAGGLLFSSVLGGFLLLVTGRTQYISSLVERRTLELESILDEAVEAIIIVNEVGYIERTNPAACRLFKFNEQGMIGRAAKSFIPALADLLEPRTGEHKVVGNHSLCKAFETQGVTINAVNVPVEIGVSKVDLPDRTIFICLIHDIAARKKVDKLKSEFISTVSHELRTPLTSISGALGILVGGAVPAVPDKAMDLLIIAKNNAERLGRLVNDILDMEKLEFGKLSLDVRTCDFSELMNQAINQNTGYALKYGVRLELNLSKVANQHIEIKVDRDRFLQVVSNLISNAVKFSHMDGVVEVSAETSGRHLTVAVKDFGTGIPEEFRSKIFQKFAQADSSDTRKRDGTGLGLSISRIIVERMGGTIDYTTEIDKGSTFFFTFPLHAEPDIENQNT